MENPADNYADIREAVRRVCSRFPDSYWRSEDEGTRVPGRLPPSSRRRRLGGLALPSEHEGGGLASPKHRCCSKVAAFGAAMNGASAVHFFGMNPVVKRGLWEMKRSHLPRVASGELRVALGVTEPDAGTNTAAIITTAERRDDYCFVRGQKVWTTKATLGDNVLLPVRTSSPAPGRSSIDGHDSAAGGLATSGLRDDQLDSEGWPQCGRLVRSPLSHAVAYVDRKAVVAEGRGIEYFLDGVDQSGSSPYQRHSASGEPSIAKRLDMRANATPSTDPSARTRASRSRWPRRTPGCARPNSLLAMPHGDTTPGCPAPSRPTSPSVPQPRPSIVPRTRQSRRTAASVIPASTTSSATGGRRGICGAHPSARRWSGCIQHFA